MTAITPGQTGTNIESSTEMRPIELGIVMRSLRIGRDVWIGVFSKREQISIGSEAHIRAGSASGPYEVSQLSTLSAHARIVGR
jgi:hypothetical protein